MTEGISIGSEPGGTPGKFSEGSPQARLKQIWLDYAGLANIHAGIERQNRTTEISTAYNALKNEVGPTIIMQIETDVRRQLERERAEAAARRGRKTDSNDDNLEPPDMPDDDIDLKPPDMSRPEGPRGPRPPEMGDKEWETSPERGRWLVDEIARLRKEFPYKERYEILDEQDRPYLRSLYEELQDYVDKVSAGRHDPDLFNLKKAYKEIAEAQQKNQSRKAADVSEEKRKEILKQMEEEAESSIPRPSTPSQRLAQTEQGGSRSTEDNEYLIGYSKEQHQGIITELTAEYENPRTTDERKDDIERVLLIYCREAQRKGILQGADEYLMSFYQENIKSNELSINKKVQLLTQAIAQSHEEAEAFYNALRKDPEVANIKGIWRFYLRLAEERLRLAIHNRGQLPPREGEFLVERETTGLEEELEEMSETYWEPGSWAGYYIITARKPKEFRRAAETFFHLVRKGSIGKSPEDVFKHLQNFKEAFGAKGSKEAERQKTAKERAEFHEFMSDLRLEFEARSYIFLADYSNETYNPKTYNQAMMAMALHEGPDRWVRLYRSGQGGVAAFTDLFDHDELMEIFINPVGNQGELDIIAQHFMQDQIKTRAIEKGIGFRLKDYDPRQEKINLANYERYRNMTDEDKKKLSEELQASIRQGEIQAKLQIIQQEIVRGTIELQPGQGEIDFLSTEERQFYISSLAQTRSAKILKNNQERLGLHMSREEFADLYEGMDGVSAHVRNYQRFGALSTELLNQLLPEVRTNLKKSIELGRIQLEFDRLRAQVRTGEIKLGKGESIMERFKELNSRDAEIYQVAYEEAEANYDIAFQMQGATAEKVRRGKGFLYIDRNVHIQAYQGAREGDEKSKNIGLILSRIKIGRKLDIFSWGVKSKTELARAAALERICAAIRNGHQLNSEDLATYNSALTAFRANLERVKSRQIASIQPDRDAIKILEDVLRNPEEVFRNLYEGVDGNGHKRNYDKFKKLNHSMLNILPNRLRMSIIYGRIQQESQKPEQMSKADKFIYDAVQDYRIYRGLSEKDKAIVVDHMPNHLAESAVQYVVNRIKIQYADAPVEVRRQAVDAGRQYAIQQIQRNGLEAIFSLPKIIFDAEGNIVEDGEDEKIDLQTAAKSILAHYTTHTYWAYQGENRHMILRPHIFKAASRIRASLFKSDIEAGLIRPENADELLAIQLLILDPTLNRVMKVEGDLLTEEMTIMNAAVEESYQDRQQIVRDVYTAFLPSTGQRSQMRIGYNFEDWGGSIRFAMGCRELAASQPTRFARRLGAGLAFIPMEIDSMPAIWGQQGVTGAINMFADQIKKYSHQGVVGQFGITKFIDQMKYGEELRVAIFGHINPETGIEEEGLFKKPLNNSEELNDLYPKRTLIEEGKDLDLEVQLLHAIIKSWGRLDKVLKLLGAEASLIRNAQGVLSLKDKEIFLEDGSFNSAQIDKDDDTGTARHSEEVFFNLYVDWLLRVGKGGGQEAYPQEQWWYLLLDQPCLLNTGITRRQWLFNKLFSG